MKFWVEVVCISDSGQERRRNVLEMDGTSWRWKRWG